MWEKWLNGDIIYCFCKVITKSSPYKALVLNPLLFTSAREQTKTFLLDYVSAQDLLSTQLVLIPVNISQHWSLVAVFTANQVVIHYNSLPKKPDPGVHAIAFSILQAAGTKWKPDGWTFITPNDVKLQKTNDDCGVYV